MNQINIITEKIIGCAFEIHNTLGCGFLEKVYENALIYELSLNNLKSESQLPMTVKYKDKIMGKYYADLVVENMVIVELKCISKLMPIHEAQLLNYLMISGIQIGLLINLYHPKTEIKRLIA